MAKGSNQKMKLVYLMKLFTEKTDANHFITMSEIIDYLAQNDISAERKSTYTDIEELRQYGFLVNGFKEGGTFYYFLEKHKFEIAELKLLVDAVQSSKFITLKKSNELIKKIESFASVYEAKELQRQVFVSNRVKTMNESIYMNVDRIHEAINSNKKISFQYSEWTVDKKLKLRNDGALYKMSPWALMWDNENYYMVAFDSTEEKIKHFRVDKMTSISILDEKRDGREEFKLFDMAVYARKMFGMFGGTPVNVRLECSNYLVGVIIDRFGKDTMIIPGTDDSFRINIDVELSRQFLAWVIGLGEGAKILSPDFVVDMMREEGERILRSYPKN